jgi:hypothetical protein
MDRIRQAFSRWRRPNPEMRSGGPAGQGEESPSSEGADLRAALIETAHERDVSIARATEAEERERLTRDRLASLAPLEHRVEVAERRALDAERRLEEISDRVNLPEKPNELEETVEPPERAIEPPEGAVEPPEGATAELRARLSRAAARKRPRPAPD